MLLGALHSSNLYVAQCVHSVQCCTQCGQDTVLPNLYVAASSCAQRSTFLSWLPKKRLVKTAHAYASSIPQSAGSANGQKFSAQLMANPMHIEQDLMFGVVSMQDGQEGGPP